MALFLLAGAELSARLVALARSTPHSLDSTALWYRFDPNQGWRCRPDFTGRIFGAHRSFDAQGFWREDTERNQGRSGPLILALGDSNFFGLAVETPSVFTTALAERLPADVRIQNLAVLGHSSAQGLAALQEYGERLAPAIVIASYNFNDRRLVLQADQVDSPAHFQSLWRSERLRELLGRIYLVRLFLPAPTASDGAQTAEAGSDPAHQDPNATMRTWRSGHRTLPLSQLYPRVAPDAYAANLRAMAQWCRAHQVRLIFVLLRDNPTQLEALHRAEQARANGRLEDALHALGTVEPDNFFATLAARDRGRILREAGRPDEAIEAEQARDPLVSVHGGEVLFHDTEYNALMRQVAEEENVELVDVGGPMQQQPEYYLDFCHFDARGQKLLADLLMPTLTSGTPFNAAAETTQTTKPFAPDGMHGVQLAAAREPPGAQDIALPHTWNAPRDTVRGSLQTPARQSL